MKFLRSMYALLPLIVLDDHIFRFIIIHSPTVPQLVYSVALIGLLCRFRILNLREVKPRPSTAQPSNPFTICSTSTTAKPYRPTRLSRRRNPPSAIPRPKVSGCSLPRQISAQPLMRSTTPPLRIEPSNSSPRRSAASNPVSNGPLDSSVSNAVNPTPHTAFSSQPPPPFSILGRLENPRSPPPPYHSSFQTRDRSFSSFLNSCSFPSICEPPSHPTLRTVSQFNVLARPFEPRSTPSPQPSNHSYNDLTISHPTMLPPISRFTTPPSYHSMACPLTPRLSLQPTIRSFVCPRSPRLSRSLSNSLSSISLSNCPPLPPPPIDHFTPFNHSPPSNKQRLPNCLAFQSENDCSIPRVDRQLLYDPEVELTNCDHPPITMEAGDGSGNFYASLDCPRGSSTTQHFPDRSYHVSRV